MPDRWKNRHKRERIFVLGAGPSLDTLLKYDICRYVTVGATISFFTVIPNYLLFNDCEDCNEHILSAIMKGVLDIIAPDFCNIPSAEKYHVYEQQMAFAEKREVLTDSWASGLHRLSSSNSVVTAVDLAYLMGASEIVLLGVDLDSGEYSKDSPRQKHLSPKFPKAGLICNDLAIQAKALQLKGIKCYNCSPRSIVPPEWKKVSLENMLARK